MKKTMIFENENAYDVWFDFNEGKEDGYDFTEDRVVIIKGTKTINGKKFNGFSSDATINCKNVKTAIRRFAKELKSNGFNVYEDEFEGSLNGEKLNDLNGSGMVVEVTEFDSGVFYINYMCYQNEVEEETTEAETTETTEAETTTAKSLLNSAYGITAESVAPTDHKYEIRVFKDGVFIRTLTFSLESFAETAFSIIEENAIAFPQPCFKVIQLFKEGKHVKRSIIHFGEKLV